MNNRIFVTGACAVLAALGAPSAAFAHAETSAQAPAEELALAHQIVELGYPPAQREAMFFGAMDQITGQMRQSAIASMGEPDPAALAILDEWIADYMGDAKVVLRGHMPAIMDGITHAYANLFTEQELRDILAFVSTPSGQRFFELSPSILSDPHFAAANQAYMNEVMASLPAAQGVLRERLTDYFEKKAGTAQSPES